LALHTTVSAAEYQVVESHGCDWSPHAQVAISVSAEAADATAADTIETAPSIASTRRRRIT
jgi:hypothetical protein